MQYILACDFTKDKMNHNVLYDVSINKLACDFTRDMTVHQ